MKFLTALLRGDRDTLLKLSTGEAKKRISSISPEEFKEKAKKVQEMVSRFEVIDEKINGNQATVRYKVIYYTHPTETSMLQLTKTPDGWKVSNME